MQASSTGISFQHFAAGEKVVRQGHAGDALSIIVSGQAVLTTLDASRQESEVLWLRSGEFFGEMALLSGEPSTVTIMAVNDLEVALRHP
jgi:CRP-like cAMP-binding protein